MVLLCVEDVTRRAAVAILLPTEDENLVLRDGTRAEPVLDVRLKGAGPDLDELPVGWLLGG